MRDPRIETLISVLDRALFERLAPDTDGWPIARGIFDALKNPRPTNPASDIKALVAPEMLATALDISRKDTRKDRGDLSQLATTVAELASDLNWWSRMGSSDDPATFTDGHAFIVGPGGLEDRDDAEIGISLLAPNVRYPDHHHPPPEVYLAMTPGAWCKNDGPWIELGIGGTVFNEPNAVHAMKSDSAPLFAFWCLLLK
ncbi:MAG: dimethylsulfonioproprionate lyase family protein [Dongiaceae bacterium]